MRDGAVAICRIRVGLMSQYASMYKRARWLRLRARFIKQHPLCRMCEQSRLLTPDTVVDHIVPHKGNVQLFWDVKNMQPLCKPCHDSVKQSIDRIGIDHQIGEDGWPTHPRHFANQKNIFQIK